MDRAPDGPSPVTRSHKPLTRPDLAHNWPTATGTVCRTAPAHPSDPASGNTGTGSDLGFKWWQVLGSNQRRLSRRFYRASAGKIANAS